MLNYKRHFLNIMNMINRFVLKSVTLAAIAIGFSGCATKNYWKTPSSEKIAKTIEFERRNDISSFLSMPGDILLLHLGDSAMASTIKQLGMYPAGLMDLLALQDPFASFLHTEFIENIEKGRQLRTTGFYPIMKQYHPNQFGWNFAVYKMVGPLTQNQQALDKYESQARYWATGYCGDYIAWLYNEAIYSWWNRTPGLQRVFIRLYPPEAIHTADHIANSPDTARIIEIREGKLIYPTHVDTESVRDRALEATQSFHPKLIRHGQAVLKRLKSEELIGAENEILIPVIQLKLTAPTPK